MYSASSSCLILDVGSLARILNVDVDIFIMYDVQITGCLTYITSFRLQDILNFVFRLLEI